MYVIRHSWERIGCPCTYDSIKARKLPIQNVLEKLPFN